jgi:PAS domain S-box-containing protein
MKIRSHLIVLVLGAVLPVLAFSAVMTAVFWREQRIAFEERFLDRVRAMSIALDRELDGNIRALQVLAESPYLQAGDLRRFYEHAVRVRATQPTWANTNLVDAATGRQVINLRRPFGAKLPEMGMAKATLMALAQSGRPFVTSLSKGPVTGEYATRIMVPVPSDGARQYILVGVIDQASWLKFLSSYPVAPDATMTLLDQDGIIIGRTLNNNIWVGKRPSPGLYDKTRKMAEGAYRNVGLEGQLFYGAHSRSKISGWTVATGVPAAGVEAALRESTIALAAAAGAMALLAVALAFIFGKRIAGPVSALARSAGALSNSEPAPVEKPTGIAEVEEVSRAFHDAAERLKIHDEELRYQTQLLGTITDHAPSMLVMLDTEGRANFVNPAAERMTGYKPEELLGQIVHEKIHHSHPDGTPYPVEECSLRRAAMQRQSVRDHEDVYVRKDGSFFDALCSATPIFRGGLAVGTVVEVQDITQRKRYEEDLEKRVRERTAELERTVEQREKLQEQLLQAQKMESLGTLAGGIAHDFNNILNIILGYASTLARNSESPIPLADGLKVIREEVERGASVVQQLLMLARKSDILFEPLDLNGLLQGLANLLQETFPKTIAISLELDGKIPGVMADPNRLNQALLNLCVNARDAMPGGGRLRLGTGAVAGRDLRERFHAAEEKQYVSIMVADTGDGIDPAIRDRVYEPFFTTKGPGEGTGLGLAAVYGIVASHHGFIDLASEPGRGTTFHIYLPARPESHRRAGPPPATESPAPEPRQANGTILLVDDEERQLDLIRSFLKDNGYRVLVARDGGEAVDLHRRHKDEIAAVVLDLGLPGLNGWEAFLKMKQAQPEVRTIVTSGYIKAELRSEMIRQGVAAIVHKPYMPDDLMAKIDAAISESAVHPA